MFKKTVLLTFALLCFFTASYSQDDSAAAVSTARAAEAPKASGRFTPTKAQIQEGQEYLKERKLYNGEASGKYNEETRSAIRVFQKESSLAVTGNFNQATLEKMNIALTDKQKGGSSSAPATADANTKSAKTVKTTASTSPKAAASDSAAKDDKSASSADGAADDATVAVATPKKAAPFQATKEQIIALQKVLISGKMFSGEANGERSDALKEGVKKYQEANGLKATGGINAVTLEKMGIPLTDKQKAQTAAAPAATERSAN